LKNPGQKIIDKMIVTLSLIVMYDPCRNDCAKKQNNDYLNGSHCKRISKAARESNERKNKPSDSRHNTESKKDRIIQGEISGYPDPYKK
jgi:hypothetical protein